MGEQEIQQKIVKLVQDAMGGNLQAAQLILLIMQAAQQGDQQAAQIAQMIEAVAQLIQGGLTQMARRGAKLNYLKQLKGMCPEGTSAYYFKAGGRVCKKCVAARKAQKGAELYADPIEEFKCGRKMRKH